MIVLDTNVVSELMRPQPESRVEAWLLRQFRGDVFLTSITQAEIFFGLEQMAPSKRKVSLTDEMELLLAEDFAGFVLPFDKPAARQFAIIAAARKHMGRPISEFDAQIAAITAAHGASLATRNVADFEHCGIAIVNPWTE